MWLIILCITTCLSLLLYHFKLKPAPFVLSYSRSDVEGVDYKRADREFAESVPPKTGDHYAVVGTGFLGAHIISTLLARGEKNITAIDVMPSKQFEGDTRVRVVIADVTKYEEIKKALNGVDVVYATFALIRFNQNLDHELAASYNVNVSGTENVIKACQECDVKYLIQTSTSNVSLGYDYGRLGMDETDPYSERPYNHYIRTKILAEKLMKAANRSKTKNGGVLLTGMIRPCTTIYGPGDKLATFPLLSREYYPTFFLDNVTDYIYVENVVLGHLLLEAKLKSEPNRVCGEVFCVSNNDALSRQQWLSLWVLLYPPTKLTFIPVFLFHIFAFISVTVQKIGKGKLSLGQLDLLTPSSMAYGRVSYTFGSEKATRILGYKPIYSNTEGIAKTIDLYLSKSIN